MINTSNLSVEPDQAHYKGDATDALKRLLERLDAPAQIVTAHTAKKGLTDSQKNAWGWNK